MSISSETRKAGPYSGNDVTSVFPFSFKVFSASDIIVVSTDLFNTESDLVFGSNYSVSLNSDQDANPGGAVITALAPATGYRLTITSAVANKQPVVLTNAGGFYPKVINDALDRATIQIQQLAEKVGRALMWPISAVGASLPTPVGNTVIGWNAEGNALINIVLSAGSSLVDLSQAVGASLIGFIQSGPGSVTRTMQDKAREIVSVKDKGATLDGSTDDLPGVNSAIANGSTSEIYIPAGTGKISATPTNPLGKRFVGPGKVLQDITIGGAASTYQVNSYTQDARLFVGNEYLYRTYNRLQNFTYTSALSTLSIRLFGDSTIQGIGSHTAPYQLASLLPTMLRAKGIPNVSVVNHGLAGSKVSAMNTALIDADTDLVFIKYGINDFNDGLATFAANLRAKLATIRGTYGVNGLSIVLVAPSATYQAFGLTTAWYEDLRNIYVQAARDYQCAFFDTYALLQDVRQAGGYWMDNAGGGQTVHPENMGQAWIWGAVLDAVFPGSSLANSRTNNLTNGGIVGYPTAAPTDLPTSYPLGISIKRATVANGWPIEGVVVTTRSVDEVVEQRVYSALSANYSTFASRTNYSAGAIWTGWAGIEGTATLQNSWVNFSTSYSQLGFWITPDKTVHIKGVISGGTATVGTLLFTLPTGMRPSKTAIIPVILASGSMGGISVNPDGTVSVQIAISATYTSLDGACFKAA